MKLKFTFLQLAFFTLFTILSAAAFAQVQPTPPGASDATTAVPTANPAPGVAKILCSTETILLKSGEGANSAFKYQWYKVNSSGTKILVKETVGNDTYSEPAGTAGYYKYELIVLNSNGCPSDPTDVTLYVLPPLNPAVNGGAFVCSDLKNPTMLTVTGLDTHFDYTYHWYRISTGVTTQIPDSAGGNLDHFEVKEQNAGTVDYRVEVAYAIKSDCTKTSGNKTITVVTTPAAPTIVVGN
jgi:hypothetical protein